MRLTAERYHIKEPRIATWAFSSTRTSGFWLIARLWLGWEWLRAGWTKVFGGTLTWRIWDWGEDAYALTGDDNIGWIRSGTVTGADGTVQTRGVGDAVAGFAQRAIDASEGPHPDVAYSWYVEFLQWIRDTAHPVVGPVVAVGELVIGMALIAGLFTGIAAALGALLNFSFVFAGVAGTNPAMILVSFGLILAWRNAGWYGLDRKILPFCGCPYEAVVGADARDARPRAPDSSTHVS